MTVHFDQRLDYRPIVKEFALDASATGVKTTPSKLAWPVREWPVIVLALGGGLSIAWACGLIWLCASLVSALM